MRQQRRASGGAAVWFPLALAFAVGIFTWYAREIHDFFVPTVVDVVVPTFVGQNETDALALGHREQLQMLVIARRTSEQYPKGIVMVQDPVAGVQVRAQRRVSLIVSDGVTYVSTPDLRDQSLRQAGLILSNLHLRLGKTKFVANNDTDAGHIVAEEPAPLTSVREGTAINFDVSLGPPTNVTVPDFIGLQVDDARSVAQAANIRLGQIVWTPFGANGPPRGVVVRQRPLADASIDGHGMISLQVSAGPHQFGYMVREAHAGVTVPLNDASAHVRVVAVDALGSHAVYDGFAAPGQHLDFVATTVGSARLETYVNDNLLDTTVLGREPQSQEEDTAAEGTVTQVDPHVLQSASPAPTAGKKVHQQR